MGEKIDTRSEAIKNVERLRENAAVFWETYLAEYFGKHNEYPPFINEENVRRFIALRSTRDANFRQSTTLFDSIEPDFVRIAIRVYEDLIAKQKENPDE